MLSSRNKIGERVAFLLHAASIVPGFAQFTSAANVCYRKDDATIQKAQTIRIEIDRHGDAVAAVAIKEERGGAVARRVAPIDDRERHARTVGRGSVQPFADILSWIVAAENRLLLAKDASARADVVVEDGARRHKGFVLKTDVHGIEFRIFTDGRIVSGLREFNAVRSCKKCRSGGS